MVNIVRKFQKIFANTALNNGKFGSLEEGSKITSSDPEVIQDLPAYEQGWNDAVISGEQLPALEEFQGLQYKTDYQLAYMLQKGIPEWDSQTDYHIGDISRDVAGTILYKSITDNNVGNALTDVVNWEFLSDLAASDNKENRFINGAMNIWQEGAIFNGISSADYTADQFIYEAPDTGTGDVTREELLPGEILENEDLRFYARITRLGDNAKFGQPIEGVGSLAGKTVTISIRARSPNGAYTCNVRGVQDFGVGGSPSADVPLDFGSIDLTTSFQRFSVTGIIPSISGKTLGLIDDSLRIFIGENTIDNFPVEVTEWDIKEGPTATPFQNKSIALTLFECQRYFEAINLGTNGRICMAAIQSSGSIHGVLKFGVQKYKVPNISSNLFTTSGWGFRGLNILTTLGSAPSFPSATTDSCAVIASFAHGAGPNGTAGDFEVNTGGNGVINIFARMQL
jgi:hypothetical protein